MQIVIFGASGDLAKRKLFPSLETVSSTKIIAYARSPLQNTFHKILRDCSPFSDDFLQKIEYVQGEYNNLTNIPMTNSLYYFSVPPSTYLVLLKAMSDFKGVIAIEKPFAINTKDFKDIYNFSKSNKNIEFRLIDHYLLKPTCLAMNEIRKKVYLKDICSVLVMSKEELGIEGRSYFNDTGIIKDILQNHLLSLYSTLFGGKDRYSVLCDTVIGKKRMIGQYREYCSEFGSPSKTETFALIEAINQKEKFKVIFLAGKGLSEKKTEIRVKYKKSGFRKVIDMLHEFNKGVGIGINNKENDNFEIILSNSDPMKNKVNLENNDSCDMVKINDLKKIELIINIAPRNEIYVVIEHKDKIYEYVIMKKDEIKNIAASLYGNLDDHAIIFDSILNKKEFPVTSLEEAEKEWELFGNLKLGELQIYEKGEDIPRFSEELLQEMLYKN
ncbi:Glucose-6-phosphate 1-dehydrogenase [Gurleya vavrai]